ncbi:MAG TPA: hypothetical protein DD490_03475 [Acidobacteria bacterium]|nr:hypothetical protein [Acidobacteriota bacterium]
MTFSPAAACPRADPGSGTSMARSVENLRIEMVDVDMARLLRAKSGAERLEIASGMFASAPSRRCQLKSQPLLNKQIGRARSRYQV